MIDTVESKGVLDLGCGLGWFCRWAAQSGAVSVHGIDISTAMLEQARSMTSKDQFGNVSFGRVDLQDPDLALSELKYDVVFSSLTLHYLPDLGPLFAAVYKCLRQGGRFVFSVEHPSMTAPSHPFFEKRKDGTYYWPLDQSVDEGERLTSWLGTEGVRKYHHMLETYVQRLCQAGFVMTGLRETWDDVDDDGKVKQRAWKASRREEQETGQRPFFLMVRGDKMRNS